MSSRTALRNSIDVLKILYMVVAGLALARGLERFVLNEAGQLEINPCALVSWESVFFIIFAATVVRFVHGAMRHFDRTYVEQPHLVRWQGVQPPLDFVMLAFEAFFFFLLAFSIEDPIHFVNFYLLLLLVDSAWLLVTTHIGSIFNVKPFNEPESTPRNWIIANLFVLLPTGIPWTMWWIPGAEACPLWAKILFTAGAVLHTIVDYPWNWNYYFGRRLRELRAQEEQAARNTIFVAGAYMGRDFNEIEEHIRLAEQYAIKLWNMGYGVFLSSSQYEAFRS